MTKKSPKNIFPKIFGGKCSKFEFVNMFTVSSTVHEHVHERSCAINCSCYGLALLAATTVHEHARVSVPGYELNIDFMNTQGWKKLGFGFGRDADADTEPDPG